MTGALILAAAGVVAATVVIVWFTFGRRWRLPDGARFEGRWFDHHVTLVVGAGVELGALADVPAALATNSARAAWATRAAWEAQGRPTADAGRYAVVHVLADADYDRAYDEPAWASWAVFCACKFAGSNGMLMSVRRNMAGGTAPLVAIRASVFADAIADGLHAEARAAFMRLVIHELTHDLQHESGRSPRDGDLFHADASLWGSALGTIETEAWDLFVSGR